MTELTWQDIKPQEGKQTLAFRRIDEVDFMVFGGARGAGKTDLITMLPLKDLHDGFSRFIYFRREYAEIMGSNGLWEKASKYFPYFDGKPHLSAAKWSFPSGASVRYSHMFQESDKERHKGLGYTGIFFDEIDHFSKDQVQYLLTCLRSEAKRSSYCVGTVNPDPDSWVLPLIEWYLDERGFPDEEKCGKIRHFVVKDGEFIFSDHEESFMETHPDIVNPFIPGRGNVYIRPKRFTFINGNCFDNPINLAKNPTYLSELNSLPDHERDRQLWGNWYARPAGSNYFQRDWLVPVDKIPFGTRKCRAWDKASSEPSDTVPSPDFTACSPIVHKCKNGYFYLEWSVLDNICDDVGAKNADPEVKGRFRKRAGERDRMILQQSIADGVDCKIVIAIDPGSNGKDAFESMAKSFVSEGFQVVSDPMPSTKSKMIRFEPFATAAQNGLVRVLKSSFPNEKTYNAFMKELEAFNGERSTSTRKDD